MSSHGVSLSFRHKRAQDCCALCLNEHLTDAEMVSCHIWFDKSIGMFKPLKHSLLNSEDWTGHFTSQKPTPGVRMSDPNITTVFFYIYAFSRHFYPKRLTVIQAIHFFLSVCHSDQIIKLSLTKHHIRIHLSACQSVILKHNVLKSHVEI